MEVIQNGISKVVNELTKRKEIIVESSNINLDADKYNMVNQLIETSLNKRATDITKEDITLIDKSTLEKLLDLVGLPENNIKAYLSSLDEDTILEKIAKSIKEYVDNYMNIQESQNDLRKQKLDTYDKYLKLLSGAPFEEMFNDFEELKKLSFSLGLSSEEECSLLKYFAKQNAELLKRTKPNAAIQSRINELNSIEEYESNPLFESVLELLKGKEIDLELVPELGIEIAKYFNKPQKQMTNMLCSILLSELYCDLEDGLNVTKEIEQVLGYTYSELDIIVERSESILHESLGISSKTIFMGNDGMQYLGSSIQDVMNDDNITYNEAIDRKTIAIIKTISETLDKSETLDPYSDEYRAAVKLLEELNTSYDELVSKKKASKVIGFKKKNSKPADIEQLKMAL